jgi:ureidoglycolate hydrolase
VFLAWCIMEVKLITFASGVTKTFIPMTRTAVYTMVVANDKNALNTPPDTFVAPFDTSTNDDSPVCDWSDGVMKAKKEANTRYKQDNTIVSIGLTHYACRTDCSPST